MALQFPSDWTGCHGPDRASGWMARPNPSPAEKSVFTKWRHEVKGEHQNRKARAHSKKDRVISKASKRHSKCSPGIKLSPI